MKLTIDSIGCLCFKTCQVFENLAGLISTLNR